ncbi:MAG: RNA polymerase factor sigma-54 [Raineya sp.]|nr:RNA polymerase factor sigma-54 [Raineya sp.]MDW8295288.1 RNA polymerase factor sigma-54 [Raineya sp.]
MQKLNLQQSLQQKLSPQQIQFIKLLQITTAELEARIQEEIAENPALEEGKEEIFDFETNQEENENNAFSDDENNINEDFEEENNEETEYETNEDTNEDDLSLDEYLELEEESYKTQDNNYSQDDEVKSLPLASETTFLEFLETQLGYLKLSEKEQIIGKQLIGSLDNDGYLRREIKAIIGDIALNHYIDVSEKEVESVLKKIQQFDPPGVAARNLQECLLIQLKRKKIEEIHTEAEKKILDCAIKVIEDNFDEFTKKHYEKIERRLNISEDELKAVLKLITKLNPKPGNSSSSESGGSQHIIPDFIVTNNNGKLEIMLNARNAPQLRISPSFAEMLEDYQKNKRQDKSVRETITFVKQKLDAAKWFIDAIKQRQETLLKTMQAIATHQYEFFLEGDETKLKPMILKDIAEKVGMDISTVSRVVSSKTVQTEFGVYPLKYFFSEGIATDEGEEASSREVKAKLKELVDNEDKRDPLSDEKLEKMLKDEGYHIARRTVAKYREQLGIPVARLRKQI